MSTPLLLAATLVLGQAGAGYVRTRTPDAQHCFHWPTAGASRTTVTFVQSTPGDPALGAGAFDAVSHAAQTWQTQLQACGSLDLVEGARSGSRLVGYDDHGSNQNLVLFRTQDCNAVVPAGDACHASSTCGNAHDCWDHGSDVLALTTVTAGSADGVVVDADTEINAVTKHPTLVDSPPCPAGAPSPSCVANDVQSFDTHEFGHLLGLAHSPDPTSTMYFDVPYGDLSRRTLDPGSKQFVCDVYPAGRPSNDCSLEGPPGPSSSGCSTTSGAGGVTTGLTVFLTFLVAWRRRSRPRRSPQDELTTELP
jgi:hypothetical protein